MQERAYTEYDRRYYEDRLDEVLPPVVLDFHAHTWRRSDWRGIPWEEGTKGGSYMVVEADYPPERLLADGSMLFPGRQYEAVCFGMPTPAADTAASNAHLASLGNPSLFPLMVLRADARDRESIQKEVREGGFLGFKVFLPWYGNDYGDTSIADMVTEEGLTVADALRLVVLLHVPGSERLAHPRTQGEVRDLAQTYPNAQIVLAHAGRCYLAEQMVRAMGSIADLGNVYLDTSMVMDTAVLATIFNRVDARRVLFATDLPVAVMKGRRVSIGTHWVDVVLDEGYPVSGYRVASRNIDATFMVYEIAHAICVAAGLVGLSGESTRAIFYDNGKAVLDRVCACGNSPGKPA